MEIVPSNASYGVFQHGGMVTHGWKSVRLMLLIRDGCEAAQFGLGLAHPQSSKALGSSGQAWPQPHFQIHYKS